VIRWYISCSLPSKEIEILLPLYAKVVRLHLSPSLLCSKLLKDVKREQSSTIKRRTTESSLQKTPGVYERGPEKPKVTDTKGKKERKDVFTICEKIYIGRKQML